jgi:hypothetical protein
MSAGAMVHFSMIGGLQNLSSESPKKAPNRAANTVVRLSNPEGAATLDWDFTGEAALKPQLQ